MLRNLSDQQFGSQTSTNTAQKSPNGQSDASARETTTLITVRGTAPSLSTRST